MDAPLRHGHTKTEMKTLNLLLPFTHIKYIENFSSRIIHMINTAFKSAEIQSK